MIYILAGLFIFSAVLSTSLFCILKYPKKSIPYVGLAILACYICFKFYLIPNRQISSVPTALNVNKVLYENEDPFGAGIIVYELPHETRLKIQVGGVNYLNTTSNKNNVPHDDDGIFENWKVTPIPINGEWTGPVMEGIPEYKTDLPQISNFLSRYNMGVDLERGIESKIDNIIKSEGSYFAYENVRLIIVSPKENIIIFAYSR